MTSFFYNHDEKKLYTINPQTNKKEEFLSFEESDTLKREFKIFGKSPQNTSNENHGNFIITFHLKQDNKKEFYTLLEKNEEFQKILYSAWETYLKNSIMSITKKTIYYWQNWQKEEKCKIENFSTDKKYLYFDSVKKEIHLIKESSIRQIDLFKDNAIQEALSNISFFFKKSPITICKNYISSHIKITDTIEKTLSLNDQTCKKILEEIKEENFLRKRPTLYKILEQDFQIPIIAGNEIRPYCSDILQKEKAINLLKAFSCHYNIHLYYKVPKDENDKFLLYTYLKASEKNPIFNEHIKNLTNILNEKFFFIEHIRYRFHEYITNREKVFPVDEKQEIPKKDFTSHEKLRAKQTLKKYNLI